VFGDDYKSNSSANMNRDENNTVASTLSTAREGLTNVVANNGPMLSARSISDG